MSNARERGDPRLDIRRALEMRELAAPPRRRAVGVARRSSAPDRGRSAGRGRRPATPLSRSSASRSRSSATKCGSGRGPAVDHDEPVEPLGRAQRERQADQRRRRHGRSRLRARDAEPVHQREHVVGHVVDAQVGRQRAVAAAGAAMVVEDDAMAAASAARFGAQ